jgi:hypothetical protein
VIENAVVRDSTLEMEFRRKETRGVGEDGSVWRDWWLKVTIYVTPEVPSMSRTLFGISGNY